MNFTAFYTSYGEPKTGLSPTIEIRRVDTGAVVVVAGAMVEPGGPGFGGGWYEYDYLAFDPTKPYAATCDGWAGAPPSPDTLDQRFTYGANTLEVASIAGAVWDEAVLAHAIPGTFGQEVQDTYTVTEEILADLENPLTIDEVNSVLELWDDEPPPGPGVVIKRWPIRDKTKLPGTVTLANLVTTTPVDRHKRTI